MKEIWEGLKVLSIVPVLVAVVFTPVWILWPLGYKQIGIYITVGIVGVLIVLGMAFMIGYNEKQRKRYGD